jgi:hypothetical protein
MQTGISHFCLRHFPHPSEKAPASTQGAINKLIDLSVIRTSSNQFSTCVLYSGMRAMSTLVAAAENLFSLFFSTNAATLWTGIGGPFLPNRSKRICLLSFPNPLGGESGEEVQGDFSAGFFTHSFTHFDDLTPI